MRSDSRKMAQSPKQSGSPSSSPSSSPRLLPLRSPAEQGSHADQLEKMLLADMEADDKWAVASNKAPRCPKKSAGDDGLSLDHRGSTPPLQLVASKGWWKVRKGCWPKWSWKSRVQGKLQRREMAGARPAASRRWRSCTSGCCKATTPLQPLLRHTAGRIAPRHL